ncbi:hypothetical protein [Streptomyces griseofuscus]|uniref:hypothetical protein n=1 Tax=Streptomyces griseofuscus TaxID=146922 RepID=UPI0033F16BFD
MTTARKTTTVFLTILCALLLTILGLTERWPAWIWATLAALLVVVPAAAMKIAAARRGPVPVVFEEQLTAPPVERTDCQVSQVALPSLWDDYDFVFSATVRWYLVESPGRAPVLNPAGLAAETVLNRARALTEKREPGLASLVQHELGGLLSRMFPDATGQLQAMAENVSLALRPQDQERLDRLAEVRKDKAVWEHQRTYEQSKRQYLGEDVLKNTGSAVVWWLAKNDEHVEKTVADLGLLAQLTSAANDSDIPERLQELLSPSRTDGPDEFDETDGPVSPDAFGGAPGHRSAADHLSDLFDAMGFPEEDPRRAMLAAQFAHIIKEQNRYETAEEVMRRFAPPEPEDDAA